MREFLGGHLVADPPDGDDRRRVAELAPNLPNVDVDGPRIAGEGVPPHALEQLVAGEHEPAMVEELPQQVELLRRELDLLVAHVHLTPARIDRELPVAQLVTFVAAALRDDAPQDALHACDELARVERLRQVVVGADLQPDDLVHVLVACGEHQDRDVGALPHTAADLDAVDVGQVEIEDHQGGHLRRHLRQRRMPGRHAATT